MMVPVRLLTPVSYQLAQLAELYQADCRLDVGHPEVEADLDEVLDDRLPAAVPVRRADIHAVLAQAANAGGYRRVPRGQHAAVSGSQQLARMERVGSQVGPGAGRTVVVAGPGSTRGVFDDHDAARIAKSAHAIQVRGHARLVNQDDCAGLVGQVR